MDIHRYIGHSVVKPYHHLSNFNECNIEGSVFVKTLEGGEEVFQERGYVFPSAEHFYWAHFLEKDHDIQRLALGGDLSTLDGLKLIMGEFIGTIKARYWSRKKSIGFVCKILSMKKDGKRINAEKLGMDFQDYPLVQYGPRGSNRTLVFIWKKILIAKYTQNKIHRGILLGTGSDILVELTNNCPEKQFFSAQVEGGKCLSGGRTVGGNIIGGNFHGKISSVVRSYIRREMPPPPVIIRDTSPYKLPT